MDFVADAQKKLEEARAAYGLAELNVKCAARMTALLEEAMKLAPDSVKEQYFVVLGMYAQSCKEVARCEAAVRGACYGEKEVAEDWLHEARVNCGAAEWLRNHLEVLCARRASGV